MAIILGSLIRIAPVNQHLYEEEIESIPYIISLYVSVLQNRNNVTVLYCFKKQFMSGARGFSFSWTLFTEVN